MNSCRGKDKTRKTVRFHNPGKTFLSLKTDSSCDVPGVDEKGKREHWELTRAGEAGPTFQKAPEL